MTLTSRFSEAMILAADIHRGQLRKGTPIPYVAHVLGVTSLALEHGADEDQAIAALLHDAIEDAPAALGSNKAHVVRAWIRLKFGAHVLEIVEGCTDSDADPKPPWRIRKGNYLARIAHEPRSTLLVSLADKVHNVRALERDYRAVGEALWERFNAEAGKSGIVGYYRALATAFRRRNEQLRDGDLAVLVESLERGVAALEELAGEKGQWPSGAP